MSGYILALYQGAAANSANNAAASMLAVIEGTGGGTGVGAGNPVQALRVAERNETRDVAATAAQPSVARDIAEFNKAVSTATTPQQLLSNPTALRVLLTASGLRADASYTALAKQVLLSNPSDPGSLVNQVASSNTSWLSATETYQFATKGLSVLGNPKVRQAIASGYAEVMWRQSLDATTPGLSDALTFQSEAGTITSASQVLADPILFNVITTAFSIPQQIVFQDRQAQVQAINGSVDFSRMKDPNYVNAITDQFLLNSQSQGTGGTTDLTSLAEQAQGLMA